MEDEQINTKIEGMKKELLLCEPRCTCCHAVVTKQRHDLKREQEGRKQRITRKRRQLRINRVKLNMKECLHCKLKVSPDTCVAFDFDHRDEETKKINISQSMRDSKAVFEHFFKTEIPKCDLLCKNCHHIKTHYNNIKLSPKCQSNTKKNAKFFPYLEEKIKTKRRHLLR